MDSKRGRERAEENRDRYMRERNVQLDQQVKDSEFHPDKSPDLITEYHKSVNPHFDQEDFALPQS